MQEKMGRRRIKLLARAGKIGEMDFSPLRTQRDVLQTLNYLMNRYDTAAARNLFRRVRFTSLASERGWSIPAYNKLVQSLYESWGESSRKTRSVLGWLDPEFTKQHLLDDRGRCRSASIEQDMMSRFWYLGDCRNVSMAVDAIMHKGDDIDYELYEAVSSFCHNDTGRQFTSDGTARGAALTKAPTVAGDVADMVREAMSEPRANLEREISRWLLGIGMYDEGSREDADYAYDMLLGSRVKGLARTKASMRRALGTFSDDVVELAVVCARDAFAYAHANGASLVCTLQDALAVCLRCEEAGRGDADTPMYCAYSGVHPLPDLAILASLDPRTFMPLVRRRCKSMGWVRAVHVDVDDFTLLEEDTDHCYRDAWLNLRAGWIEDGEPYDPDEEIRPEDSEWFERWEPYEYWVVEGMVQSALERHGERVIRIDEIGEVWLRGCTGQSVIHDGWASAEFRRLTARNEYGEYDPFLDRLMY